MLNVNIGETIQVGTQVIGEKPFITDSNIINLENDSVISLSESIPLESINNINNPKNENTILSLMR